MDIDDTKFYTADEIRKMMPYASYTAEDFALKIIMPEIITAAINNKFVYTLNLFDPILLGCYNVNIHDVEMIFKNIGFHTYFCKDKKNRGNFLTIDWHDYGN